ncbi:MAG: hypothetical protein U1E61_15710 [Bradyrhizobium sp.]
MTAATMKSARFFPFSVGLDGRYTVHERLALAISREISTPAPLREPIV